MKIGLIGNGFVGLATQLLRKTNDITNQWLIYDIDPNKCEPKGLKFEDLCQCNLVFICVPTPMTSEGQCYIGIVDQVVKDLQRNNVNKNKPYIIIRSTVPPGTSDKLGTFFMPEFLTEKNWAHDFVNCTDWIFGLNKNFSEEINKDFQIKITNLFNYAYDQGLIKSNAIHFIENKEAEMLKYVKNNFLALKVSFCNEIYQFCQLKDIDYQRVIDLVVKDPRITDSHVNVPGPDGKYGFGGTCFPKDTAALRWEMENNGMKSYIIDAAIRRNEEQDRTEKDWEKNKGRAIL